MARVSDELAVGRVGDAGDIGEEVIGVLRKISELGRIAQPEEAHSARVCVVASGGGDEPSVRLEGKGQEGRVSESAGERMPMGSITPTPAMNQQRATGTWGATGIDTNSEPGLDFQTQNTRFGGTPQTTVEYTAPPEAKR